MVSRFTCICRSFQLLDSKVDHFCFVLKLMKKLQVTAPLDFKRFSVFVIKGFKKRPSGLFLNTFLGFFSVLLFQFSSIFMVEIFLIFFLTFISLFSLFIIKLDLTLTVKFIF